MQELIRSGANINARNRESKNHTALHEAVIGGHIDVAKYLLDMGANQVKFIVFYFIYFFILFFYVFSIYMYFQRIVLHA